MLISVVGCGYLGAVHAAAMASLGHEVIGIDVDARKIERLASGSAPLFEPGLDDLLAETVGSGLLRFSTDFADAAVADVHFISVGTPQSSDSGASDLRYLHAAVSSLLPHLRPGSLVVGKSTVPVGTAAGLAPLFASAGARLVWNPEFLREGHAIADTLSPDRLVYGMTADDTTSTEVLDRVYAQIIARGMPRIVTDLATAELVKVSANAFLATKISFINAMAEVAETVGADVVALADAIGHDARIGRRFLNAGVGFGGGCLPKDIRSFVARAEELDVGHAVSFLREMDEINLRRRQRVVDLLTSELGGLEGARIAVLGLAFKPDSDDIRDSPALDVARRLRVAGAVVTATDPRALDAARRTHPEIDITYVSSAVEALRGVDGAALLTEWDEYARLDPAGVERSASPVMIDGRNALDPERWRAAGWRYRGLGRA